MPSPIIGLEFGLGEAIDLLRETTAVFCRKEIASFKVPRHVRFVTEWPMSSSKIQKFRLRVELVRELGLE